MRPSKRPAKKGREQVLQSSEDGHQAMDNSWPNGLMREEMASSFLVRCGEEAWPVLSYSLLSTGPKWQ